MMRITMKLQIQMNEEEIRLNKAYPIMGRKMIMILLLLIQLLQSVIEAISIPLRQ
jgi:hypothetical protein